MKEKFLSYYWPWFKVFGITFSAIIFLRAFTNLVDDGVVGIQGDRLLGVVIFLCLATIFVGGILQFYHEKYKPWRIRKIFTKSLLNKVIIEGFTPDLENQCLEGYCNGYMITLNAETDSDKGDYISINVFIDIRKSEVDFILDEVKEYNLLQHSGFYWITHDEVIAKYNQPPIDKIKERIADMTTKLVQLNVLPYTGK